MSNKVIAIWGTVVVLLVISIYVIGITHKEELKYITLKTEVKEKTKEYIEANDIKLPVSITSEFLEELGYLDSLKLDNKLCAADINVKKKFVFTSYDIDFTCVSTKDTEEDTI